MPPGLQPLKQYALLVQKKLEFSEAKRDQKNNNYHIGKAKDGLGSFILAHLYMFIYPAHTLPCKSIHTLGIVSHYSNLNSFFILCNVAQSSV